MDHATSPTPAAGTATERRSFTLIRPSRGLANIQITNLWRYRELLFFFIWRDVKVRYKQTAIGAAWAVIQPLFTVLLFSAVFGLFAKLPSDGAPYFLSTFAAFLSWNLFAGAVNRSGTSLVSSANLVSKVYFPRVLIPIAAVLGSVIDFVISLALLVVILIGMGRFPGLPFLTLPIWAALTLLLSAGVGIGLSALNVRYRDITYALGFLLQLWMYASPIAYSASIVPERWRFFYQLNPMVAVVQGFRWALLGDAGSFGIPWVSAVVITLALLASALAYFASVERKFADLI